MPRMSRGVTFRMGGHNEGTWICPVNVQGSGAARDEKVMSIGFQVADVKKPLIAVRRIIEQGNQVGFGPREEDNYIKCMKTGDKVF